jgi:hypothetical protein
MILPLTTNPDRDMDGLKDRPCISPSSGCYMYLEKKIHQIEGNYNLIKKNWLKINIP